MYKDVYKTDERRSGIEDWSVVRWEAIEFDCCCKSIFVVLYIARFNIPWAKPVWTLEHVNQSAIDNVLNLHSQTATMPSQTVPKLLHR